MADEAIFYEVLPAIFDESGETQLSAAFTPNNGIRVQLSEREMNGISGAWGAWTDWRCFDFTAAQAEMIGQALVRWAQRNRAEAELVRCNMHIRKTPQQEG